MNGLTENSNSQILHRFLNVFIEQLDAPIDEVKMWLLSTPTKGSFEETQTMIYLLEKVQKQVRAQIELLATVVNLQSVPQAIENLLVLPTDVDNRKYEQDNELLTQINQTVDKPITHTILTYDDGFERLLKSLGVEYPSAPPQQVVIRPWEEGDGPPMPAQFVNKASPREIHVLNKGLERYLRFVGISLQKSSDSKGNTEDSIEPHDDLPF